MMAKVTFMYWEEDEEGVEVRKTRSITMDADEVNARVAAWEKIEGFGGVVSIVEA